MPDAPSPSEFERSLVLGVTWFTAAASATLLVLLLLGISNIVTDLSIAVTASAFISLPFTRFFDDYHQSLQNAGLRLAAIPISLWFATFVMDNLLGGWTIDPLLGLAIIAFTYHAGIILARVRGTFG